MNPFHNDIALLAPELFMGLSTLALLIIGAFRGNKATTAITIGSIVVTLITLGEFATDQALWTGARAFSDMFISDGFAVALKSLVLVGIASALAISIAPLKQDTMQRFEYPVLVMLSGLGMMIMLSANDFLSVYVGLEMSSLALYVLAAFRRETVASAEAGMKYFILGALSSGMLLFGISLVYGFSGTVNFHDIAESLLTADAPTKGLVVGMAFILAGLAFKISAVPFHMWTPDVYQGAPYPVTALFAMVPKIAAMGMLARILFVPFGGLMVDWGQIVAFMALASMMWGSFAAIAQSNIKRLLAYSSIGNMGFALVGIVAGTPAGLAATILYMTIYLAMTAGTFAVLLAVRRDDTAVEAIDDFTGLSRTQPVAAYALAIMMFAMSGLPPLAGFFGKLMVFQAAVAQGFYVLAVAGVVTSVVASYYYLRIIRVMFFDKPRENLSARMDIAQGIVLALALIVVIGLVVVPGVAYDVALTSAKTLFPAAP